jgi:hypothetical protein
VAAIDPVALHVSMYDKLLDRGMPPRITEIAAHFGIAPNEARTARRAPDRQGTTPTSERYSI